MADAGNGKEEVAAVEPPGLDDSPASPTEQAATPELSDETVEDGETAAPSATKPSTGSSGSGEAITENYDPGPVFTVRTRPGTSDDSVRKWLAVGLTGLLVLLALVAAFGWLIQKKSLADIQSFLLVMSPIVTLTGTILGFYFSSGKQNSSA